jgi:hypothetical protein
MTVSEFRTSAALKERVKFALEWEKRWEANERRVNVSELSREFGISRQPGAVVQRYRSAGHETRALEKDLTGLTTAHTRSPTRSRT